MKIKMALMLIVFVAFHNLKAQNINREVFTDMELKNSRRILEVPNIDHYITIKGDFHIHTIFSDGNVWPTTRVDEAWADGLDAIAISDHDIYRPHQQYLNADHHTSYEIAKSYAAEKNIILIKAIEITKWEMPPGHLNALFIKNGNLPEMNDATEAGLMTYIEKLYQQDAFILWNHPGWAAQQKDTVLWFDFHQNLLDKGWLKGVEVFNYNEWYPVALRWAVTKGLAPFANTDIHEPIRWTYGHDDDFIRPMTLVFAEQRTEESIHKAMNEKRTVAWFHRHLAGEETLLGKLFDKSLTAREIFSGKGKKIIEITNATDFHFQLRSLSKEWDHPLEIQRRSVVSVKVPDVLKTIKVEVLNWHIDAEKNLIREISLPVK